MITHYIPHICYKCLCRVCGQLGCPHRPRQEKRCWSCWRSHDFKPILDCSNFYFRQVKKFRYKRIVHKKAQVRYIEKFSDGDIAQLLCEILRLLHSPVVPSEDINCIKSGCLCLDCPASSICKHRCELCRNWKGENPVRLCGVRTEFIQKGGC